VDETQQLKAFVLVCQWCVGHFLLINQQTAEIFAMNGAFELKLTLM